MEYFETAVAEGKTFSNRVTKSYYRTKDEMAIDFNLFENQFYAICGDDNELDEIRVCYNIRKKGDKYEKVMDCPKSKDRN